MVLLYVFAAVVFINCCYFILFSRFSFATTPEVISSETPPVSLIICAKNEAENLQKYIPEWQAQEYPDFEIILINDASADNTLEVIESFAEKDSRIKVVNVKNIEAFWANKKYALTLGLKRAVNTRLIFSDADCSPASKQWLKEMASRFSEEKQLVLGYGAYQKRKGILNRLIRFETLMTAVQYFSYANAGIPYMGVGRNLAYTSDLYYGNNGFMSHIKLSSGDDDLFVNEVATKNNTALSTNPSSFTYSIPKKTWKAWKLQKRRHATTASHYKLKHKLLLALYYTSNLLFWVLGIVCFFLIDWKIPLALVTLRFLVQFIVIGKAASKLNEKDLLYFLPLWELFLVWMQMSIFISNKVSKPAQWK